jgi:hypothetical protein
MQKKFQAGNTIVARMLHHYKVPDPFGQTLESRKQEI